MILDSLASSSRYETLGPRFAQAFRWLRSADPASLPDGKTVIDGDELYVLAQRGLSKPLDQVKWEAHRRYADIQYIVAGSERMMWQNLGLVTLGDYTAEKDFQALSTTTAIDFSVTAGQYAIFFPEDAHRPGIEIPGATPVFKLVFKVKL